MGLKLFFLILFFTNINVKTNLSFFFEQKLCVLWETSELKLNL